MIDAPPLPKRPLLFLDYDGTLAPIVEDPASAAPHPSIPDLLAAVAERHPTWVVTGRDLAALARLLPAEVDAVGLHGAEQGRLGGEIRSTALDQHAEAFAMMRVAAPRLDGVHIEEKSGAFAIHYRQAEDRDAARQALERWAADTPEGLEPVWGKKVVELRPVGVTKGIVTARIARDNPDRTPVYIGDDVTDEDAFRELPKVDPSAVTVKVGAGATEARYRLPDVEAVVEYLKGFLTR
jgi:trehalose 6-phosphate phosphatase